MFIAPINVFGQQRSFRADSLQFKVYTRLYINERLAIDSIVVKKVFCDYCSEKQLQFLKNEAYRMTRLERRNPEYQSSGEHRIALFMRYEKEGFKKIKSNQ